MLTGNQIRQRFIKFFEEKAHKHYESASLIPDDPTLLLTVAGMVPFKPYFLGQKEAPTKRITTYQKCIRTNDLENVGRTARHHTFFEMLGNFSFGDYFKEEAIVWSWEFITEVLKLKKETLWVSVYTTDDEAERIWIEKCNFPKERIVRMGDSENWWAAGPTGSCGPSSEIHVDLGVEYGGDENSKLGDEGTDNRFIEIWNLVFTEWNRMEDGRLEPLPKKNIDTGAGLERVTAVVQGKSNNFETDLLYPILEKVEELTDSRYKENEKSDFSLKVITDHIRAITFLISDGVIPSNEGRGYVLRRIIRRAVRHGRLLGKKELFLFELVDKVVEIMENAYSELKKNIEHIKKIVKIEEEKFSDTLDLGIHLVMEEIRKVKSNKKNNLSGDVTFKLYDTYGFPYELTEEICEENKILISKDEFLVKMDEQRQKARAARTVIMEQGQDDFIEKIYDVYGKTQFVGYDTLMCVGKLLNFKEIEKNKYVFIFDKTPFYAESGGQESDYGVIENDRVIGKIVEVQKQKEIYSHIVEFDSKIENGNIFIGENFNLSVDPVRREEVTRNHTATHLLHQALKDILGEHVQQAGSLCGADRLRFDFNHYEAMTSEEIEQVEKTINQRIFMATRVNSKVMSLEEAKKKGATALFSDKYGSEVRVVSIGDYSVELCGGTHMSNIGTIGLFKIISETGVSAGVRRIEAQTGYKAYLKTVKDEKLIKNIAKNLKTDIFKIEDRSKKIVDEIKDLTKKLELEREKLAKYEAKMLYNDIIKINEVDVLIKGFKDKNIDYLSDIIDKVKDRFEKSVVVLGSNNGKAIFAVGVSKNLTTKIKAGDIVRQVAKIAEGNGGGRPDFAQAGGKNGEKVQEALDKITDVLKETL